MNELQRDFKVNRRVYSTYNVWCAKSSFYSWSSSMSAHIGCGCLQQPKYSQTPYFNFDLVWAESDQYFWRLLFYSCTVVFSHTSFVLSNYQSASIYHDQSNLNISIFFSSQALEQPLRLHLLPYWRWWERMVQESTLTGWAYQVPTRNREVLVQPTQVWEKLASDSKQTSSWCRSKFHQGGILISNSTTTDVI